MQGVQCICKEEVYGAPSVDQHVTQSDVFHGGFDHNRVATRSLDTRGVVSLTEGKGHF